MSVVLAQSGERPTAGGGDDTFEKKSKTRTFFIKTNDIRDGTDTVLAAAILPKLFDFYQTATETNTNVICIRRKPEKIGPFEWEVVVDYETPQPSTRDPSKPPQPPDTNVQTWYQTVSLGFEQYEEPLIGNIAVEGSVTHDLAQMSYSWVTSKSAINSAGEPFNPPIVAIKYRPVLTFAAYSEHVDLQRITEYVGATNSDVFFGAEPRQLRITEWTVPIKESATIGDITVWFYTHTIKMVYKRDTWDITVLNHGTYYKQGSEKRSFVSDDGHPFIGLLTATGTVLPSTADPTFQTFRYYREKPFGVLGLIGAFP